MKKIEKFNYQLIPSSHKGFKEVLVTFDYKGKTIHYYSFIKENAKLSGKQYIAEAKKEVEELTKTGKIYKYAKKYLHYPVKETEEVKTVTVVKQSQGKAVAADSKAAPVRTSAPGSYKPFLAACIIGTVAFVVALVLVICNLVITYLYKAPWLIPDDVAASITTHYYIAAALGGLAVLLLVPGIPLLLARRGQMKVRKSKPAKIKAKKKK